MNVFVLDGTYELFRHFYAVPSISDHDGNEVGAVLGVIGSVLGMLENNVTHLGVATDHVIESFRNKLWPHYKKGTGIEPALIAQFEPLEDVLDALGVVVWRMVEFEADDALASAAVRAAEDPRVEQVFICTPDKDLAQCVRDRRIVQFDRRAGTIRDADGVRKRFAVDPASIPDYLGLVGDTADGFPGLPGWGAKSAGTVLGRYGCLEDIPNDAGAWDITVRGAERLARTLTEQRESAELFRTLATLRTDVPVFTSVSELEWAGPKPGFFDVCTQLNAPGYFRRAQAVVEARSAVSQPRDELSRSNSRDAG